MTSPATPQSLREYVRGHASEFLVDPNITSVGVGHKVVDGRRIDEVCVQFTVRQKVDLADLETLGSAPIPESVEVREHTVRTDVLERSYGPGAARGLPPPGPRRAGPSGRAWSAVGRTVSPARPHPRRRTGRSRCDVQPGC